MKSKYRLALKQGTKYFLWLLIAILGVSLYRVIYSIPEGAFYYMIGIIGLILTIGFIFDAISTKDILPIIKN